MRRITADYDTNEILITFGFSNMRSGYETIRYKLQSSKKTFDELK